MLVLIAACLLLATEPPADVPADMPAPSGAESPEPTLQAEPATAPATEPPIPAVTPDPVRADPPHGPPRLVASLGVERSMPGGRLAKGVPMNDFTSSLLGLRVDLGFRITPRWTAAVVADVTGGGSPGFEQRGACDAAGVECATSSIRLSIEGRYVFSPEGSQSWWAGAGFGGETARVTIVGSDATPDYLPTYEGAVFPRLSGGWDHRVNRWFGWGVHGAVSMGRYTKKAKGDSEVTSDLPGGTAVHSWLDLGVRAILFP